MTNPTPTYNVGDRVEITARKCDGEVVERWYSKENGWLYRIHRAGGDRQVGIYQEESLTQ